MKNIIKNKKAEGVFGMSFSMIFSIILIVFFIIVAFTAITFFLNYQKKVQVGLFLGELENEIKAAMNSDGTSFPFNSTLPSGIKDICFIDLNAPIKNANTNEKLIYGYIMDSSVPDFRNNVYIYSPGKNYGFSWKLIKNINLSKRNPICIPVEKGVISIKIERKFEDASVSVSAA